MAWKIEKRHDNEKDEWLDGYGTVAATVGVWGVAMWIVTKIFNGIKVIKIDDEVNETETTDEE